MIERLWKRAPLAWLLVAGGALYLALGPYLPAGKEAIVIDADTREGLLESERGRLGRELTEEDEARAIRDYADEEILIREAYRNGWHLENGRVRQRLLLAMRTTLTEVPPEPTTSVLRAYFQANVDRYRLPESVSFQHVFFASDSPAAPQSPDAFLSRLRAGQDWQSVGEPYWRGATIERESQYQIAGGFGDDFAERVFALRPGSWAGPVSSNRGTHYVRVTGRFAPEVPEFDSVERIVRMDWVTSRTEEARARRMSRLAERYEIVRGTE